jgi:hypothetical protein
MSNPGTSHAEPCPQAQAAYLIAWPVPYRLTPRAEALLAEAETSTEARPDGTEPEAGT